MSGASPKARASTDTTPKQAASTAPTAPAASTAPPEQDLLAFDSGPINAPASEETKASASKAPDPFGAIDGGAGGAAFGAAREHNSDPFTGGGLGPVATGPPPAPLQAPNGHANPFALAETAKQSPKGGSPQLAQPGSASVANPFGSNAFSSGALPPPIVVPGQQSAPGQALMQPSLQGNQPQQFPGQGTPTGYGSMHTGPPGYGMPPQHYSQSLGGQYGPYGVPPTSFAGPSSTGGPTGYGAPSPSGGPAFGMFAAPQHPTWPGQAPHTGSMHGVSPPYGGGGQPMYGTTSNPFGGVFGASATGMPAVGYGPPANPFASTATGSVPSWNPNVNRDTFNDLLIEHNKRTNPAPPMAAPMRAKDEPAA
jgi:hypothetical protein